MFYLLDTNIVSELRKGPRCHPAVDAWEREELTPKGGGISVITIGEIRKGIELISKRDKDQANRLEDWFQRLVWIFADVLLPVTLDISNEWGRLCAIRPLSAPDALLAATANVHGLTVATRNIKDFRDIGVRVCNPFEYEID